MVTPGRGQYLPPVGPPEDRPTSIMIIYIVDAAAGVSDDYAKSIGIKNVYCIELRPVVETHPLIGFGPKGKEIILAGKEALAGILVAAKEMIN